MVKQELINGCKNGDRKAQRELYESYSTAIYGCCLKYAPNKQEAQDILQDSFITIFENVHQFEYKGSFEGWCKRIAINTALQRYRGASVYAIEDNSAIVAQEIEIDNAQEIGMEEMLAMVQQLPDRYRMVFSLYALDGHSHKEIAGLMSISEGTSKSQLFKARKLLQSQVNQNNISYGTH